MGSMRSLTLVLLLAVGQHAVEASVFTTAINYLANKAVSYMVPTLAGWQPSITRVIDSVAAKRKARGDKQGEQRALKFKQWFDFTGFTRGVPAVGVELLRHQGSLTDAWVLISGSLHSFQQRSDSVGLVQAWQEQQADLGRVTSTVVNKLMSVLPVGACRSFFHDLWVELIADSHLANDLVETLVPDKDKRQQALKSLEQYLGSLRSALEKEKHKPSEKKDKRRSSTETEL